MALQPVLLNPSDQDLAKQCIRWRPQARLGVGLGLEALAVPDQAWPCQGGLRVYSREVGFWLLRPGQGLWVLEELKRLAVGL